MLRNTTFSAALYFISGMLPKTGVPGGPSKPGILAFFRANSLVTKYDNGNKRSMMAMDRMGWSIAWVWTNDIRRESILTIHTSKDSYVIVRCYWQVRALITMQVVYVPRKRPIAPWGVRKEEAGITKRPYSVMRNHYRTSTFRLYARDGLLQSTSLKAWSSVARNKHSATVVRTWCCQLLVSFYGYVCFTVGYGFVFSMLASFFRVSARVVGFSARAW